MNYSSSLLFPEKIGTEPYLSYIFYIFINKKVTSIILSEKIYLSGARRW